MRKFFRHEYAALFVGPAPAYRPHKEGDQSFLRKIPKIQSVSYGFDIGREEIKQLGHEDLLTRRINVVSSDPAPGSNIDVNIEPVPVSFEFEYLPTCGLTEYLLNFNVVPSGHPAENSFISRHFGDKNFFLVLRDDPGGEAYQLQHDEDYYGHYVMGVGNAFATNWEVSAQVNSPIVAKTAYQASNLTVDQYSGKNYIPAIHLYDGKYKKDHEYSFMPDDMYNEYDTSVLLSNNIKLKIEELNIGGSVVSRENANANSFGITIDLQRRNLYGLGSMYPYDRKLNLPARGNLSLGVIKKDLETGNLNQILKRDKPYKIYIDCMSHCPSPKCDDDTKPHLMTYVIDNAVLKSKNTSIGIGSAAEVDINFDFTLTKSNGFLVSGGCLLAQNVPGANDSVPCNPDASSASRDDSEFCDPFIAASMTPSTTQTPSHTKTPTKTPTQTRTETPTNTQTKTITSTCTQTKTPTQTLTQTPTPTPTLTQTNTPTITQTQTQTQTPTLTQTQTQTQTQTLTQTQTPTLTQTQTQTQTPTLTQTQTQTQTPTLTQTQTQTHTQTQTPTLTQTQTPTLTQTPTVTPTRSKDPFEYPPVKVDQYVRFQYSSTYIVEGDSGDVTVYRDISCGPTLSDYPAFTIDYATEDADDSAVAGSDYRAAAGTLTFGVNEMEKTISLQTLPMPGVENSEHDEFFMIRLSNGVSTLANVKITGSNPYSVVILDPS